MNLIKSMYLKFTAMLMLALTVAAGLSSCSKNGDKRAELLECVNDEALAIVAFNPAVYIESAGGKVEDGTLTMPPAIEKLMKDYGSKSDRRVLDRIGEIKGVNLESAVIAIYADDNDRPEPCILYYVTDKDEMAKWLEDNGVDEEKDNDFKVFANEDEHLGIVVDGDIAYMVVAEDASSAVDKVEDFKRLAEQKELAEWKKDYLADENKAAAALVFMRDIPESEIEDFYNMKEINDDAEVLAFEQTLDGLHLQTAMKFFDKEGQPCDIVSKSAIASIDPKILTYFPDNYCLFGAFSFKGDFYDNIRSEATDELNKNLLEGLFGDNIRSYGRDTYDPYWGYWTGYSNPMREAIDSVARSNAFRSASEQITGFGMGFGFDKDTSFDVNHPERILNDLSARAVAKFANDAAATSYYKAWNDVNMAGQTPGAQVIGFKPYELGGQELFMMRKGSDIIMSDEKSFDTSSHSYPCKLDEAVGFASLNLPKNGAVIKALPVKIEFGVKAWALVSRNSVVLDITLTDAEGGFIQNLLELGLKVGNWANSQRSSYDSYESDAYATEVYADTVAAIEDYSVAVEEAVPAEEW